MNKASLCFLILLACSAALLGTAAVSTQAEYPQWCGQEEGDFKPEFSVMVIRTQEGWARLWRRLDRPIPQPLEEPREMAVFIAMGKRPTGGFRPRIVTAIIKEDKLVVVYTDGKPPPEDFVTQALTYPWVVALLPQTSLPVVAQAQSAP
jgi:hypothetical protein